MSRSKLSFEAGAKLRLKPYCESFKHGGPGVNSGMIKYFNTDVTVTYNVGGHSVKIKEDNMRYYWHTDWFERPDFKMLKAYNE